MKVSSPLKDRFTTRSPLSPLVARRRLEPSQFEEVYRTLRRAFGHQKWWPGETPFEVMVGAILTQNTAWTNVEKAIANLRQAGALTPRAMRKLPERELAGLIRPAGYFNIKARRLRSFLDFFLREYGGSIDAMRKEKGSVLREKLLSVSGIGPETADSILLYALDKTFFVIDAYTKRIFSRHGVEALSAGYETWQTLFTASLPARRALYNDYHAQIVHLGKHFCRASQAFCDRCPLRTYL